MGSINIVHLSDLHIDEVSLPEITPISNALCSKIEQYRADHQINNLDLLVISGDLANKGSDSYSLVNEIIKQVSEAANIDENQIFLVPGNHDVDRSRCKLQLYPNLISQLKNDPDSFLQTMRDKTSISLLEPQFERYKSFSEQFPLMGNNSIKTFEIPGFILSRLQIGKLDIRLCGLNTAIVAGPGDNDKDDHPKPDSELYDRCCGYPYLSEMLFESKHFNKESLNIIVSHYPLAWINSKERSKVEQLLQQKACIFLTGHIHRESAETSGWTRNQLLQLGVGSAHSKKWNGRYHCRIIELKSDHHNAFLHDWIWSGQLGWRAFEPFEAQCSGWITCRHNFDSPSSRSTIDKIQHMANSVGIVDIRNNRSEGERNTYYESVIKKTSPGSKLFIVGRSLRDWSNYAKSIEEAINEKGIHVKLALLDENSLPNKKSEIDNSNFSWIEKPIGSDWAMTDVTNSMNRLRRIQVSDSSTGSLEIYGLPFYTSHSFVTYTNIEDNKHYCSEESGMGLEIGVRPFLEVHSSENHTPKPKSYTQALRTMYTSMLTLDRLLIKKTAKKQIENNTTNRSKIIIHKIENFGLVDLTIDRDNIDYVKHDLISILKEIPENGEIFMVGRSLIVWDKDLMSDDLIHLILKKQVRCNLVIADPSIANLSSLVKGDYAIDDLDRWRKLQIIFEEKLKINSDNKGYLEIFGIPAYLPVSFASYCIVKDKNFRRFCTLEPGIAVIPADRPIICFEENHPLNPETIGSVNPDDYDGDDIYNKLNKIYRKIIYNETISNRTKLLFSSKRKFKQSFEPYKGNAHNEGKKAERPGWFIGSFLDTPYNLCQTSDVEIKWGIHTAGDSRTEQGTSDFASTLTLLINGKFVIKFPKTGKQIELTDSGDFTLYPPGVSHTWEAIENCLVLTVRWPSINKNFF